MSTVYQGTPNLLLTAQGKEPLQQCRVIGNASQVTKVYDRSAKGYIVDIAQTNLATKIAFPAQEKKSRMYCVRNSDAISLT